MCYHHPVKLENNPQLPWLLAEKSKVSFVQGLNIGNDFLISDQDESCTVEPSQSVRTAAAFSSVGSLARITGLPPLTPGSGPGFSCRDSRVARYSWT